MSRGVYHQSLCQKAFVMIAKGFAMIAKATVAHTARWHLVSLVTLGQKLLTKYNLVGGACWAGSPAGHPTGVARDDNYHQGPTQQDTVNLRQCDMCSLQPREECQLEQECDVKSCG